MTTTGCDISDSTTTTTNALTITARCNSAACAGGICDATSKSGTAQFPADTFTPTSTPIVKRDLPFQSPGLKTAKPIPSDKEERETGFTGSVAPRDEEDDEDGDIEEFWLDEWSQVDPEVKHREDMNDDDGRDEERLDTHSSSRVRAFGKQGFNMGVQGLIGCTSIILVSRRAVWMSHNWEDPSFTSRTMECPNNDIYVGVGFHVPRGPFSRC